MDRQEMLGTIRRFSTMAHRNVVSLPRAVPSQTHGAPMPKQQLDAAPTRGSTVGGAGSMGSVALVALPRLASGSFQLMSFGTATLSAIVSAPILLFTPNSNPGGASSALFSPEEISALMAAAGGGSSGFNTSPGDPNQHDPEQLAQQRQINNSQLGRKFGEHRDPNLLGYRTHTEYRALAQEIYANPVARVTRFTTGHYAGETHYQLGNNLLGVGPDGSFRSLYPMQP